MADSELVSHRIPPQNIEAEISVLGGILIENESISKVIEILNHEDFYKEAHRKIYLSLIDQFEKNEPSDLITITNQLKNKNKLEEVGGITYLTSLVDNVPTAANITYYAKIVKEKSILRKLINAATQIVTHGYEGSKSIGESLDQAEKLIFQISEERVKPSFVSIKEVVKSSFETIEKLYERKELITGVPSGFEQFDKITAGFQPADLIIIAGRPSMGKTAFSLNIAQYAAIKANTSVAIFSLEMSKEQLALRMLCSQAKVDSSKLRSGFLGEKDWPKLTRAAGILTEASIFIDDTPGISVLEMRAKGRRLQAEHGVGLIIVDYLQLMQGRAGANSREQEISEISRSLKGLARELNVPMIALSQLNRALEGRVDKKPILADLRESGAIEQDADVIAFVFRDELYDRSDDNPNKGIAEIIVGKQRNGPTGSVKLTFLDKYTSFENRAPDQDDSIH